MDFCLKCSYNTMVTIRKNIKEIETEIVKSKGGPVTKQRKEEIIESLTELIENGNILGITNKQLSIQYKVKRETISKYLKEIYSRIPEENIKEIEIKLKVMFDKIFRYAQRLMNQASTPVEQERALRLLLQCMKEYTDFLERFGYKPVATQNIDLNANITQRSLNIQIIKNGIADNSS